MVFSKISKWLGEIACYTSEIELYDVDLVSSLPSYEDLLEPHAATGTSDLSGKKHCCRDAQKSHIFPRKRRLHLEIAGLDIWLCRTEPIIQGIKSRGLQKAGRALKSWHQLSIKNQAAEGRVKFQVALTVDFRFAASRKRGVRGLKTHPISVYPDGDWTGISTRNSTGT
jgi:hypothetical protein